jgi:hypothetical protein
MILAQPADDSIGGASTPAVVVFVGNLAPTVPSPPRVPAAPDTPMIISMVDAGDAGTPVLISSGNASPSVPPATSAQRTPYEMNIRFVPAVVAKFRELAGRDPSQAELERFAPRFGGQAGGYDTWASIDAAIAKLGATPAPGNAAPSVPSMTSSVVASPGTAVNPNAADFPAPDGYRAVATENESVTFDAPTDVAYGGNGKFVYRSGVVGTVRFDNATFGDPIYGTIKQGYVKSSGRLWILLGVVVAALAVWWFARKRG